MSTVHMGQLRNTTSRDRYTLPIMKLTTGSMRGNLCPTLSQYELSNMFANIGNGNISTVT